MDDISVKDRLMHSWNAFRNKDPVNPIMISNQRPDMFIQTSSDRPDRRKRAYSVDPTLINSILNRISVDASEAVIEHIRTDDEGRYLEDIHSTLNDIFTVEANVDQTAQAFILDIVRSLLDEGTIAVIPTETLVDPSNGLAVKDIVAMRTGKVTNWSPSHVTVELYNDLLGRRDSLIIDKKLVAIIENPFYEIMNEANSVMRRLNRRLSLLDQSDENNASAKLDLLIQMPYVVKSDLRKNQAQSRRDEIQRQLNESDYGVAYIDGTEKIIQLNRAVESNVLPQIEYLTTTLMTQLGLTPEILNMTADEQTMTNYYRRIVDPILNAITNEFKRKFLTKTARTQNQTIWWHREPFAFTTTSTLAEVADKFTRNEILSPNEVRSAMAYKPKRDGKSDELRNRNLNQSKQALIEEVDLEQTDEPV